MGKQCELVGLLSIHTHTHTHIHTYIHTHTYTHTHTHTCIYTQPCLVSLLVLSWTATALGFRLDWASSPSPPSSTRGTLSGHAAPSRYGTLMQPHIDTHTHAHNDGCFPLSRRSFLSFSFFICFFPPPHMRTYTHTHAHAHIHTDLRSLSMSGFLIRPSRRLPTA